MKKIGLYIPHLSNGGAERVVSRLSKIMNEMYEVYVIVNEEIVNYNVDCTIINLNIESTSNPIKKIFLPILRSYKLKKVKNELNLDCIISFLTSANIVNCLSKNKHSKTVVSVRNFSDFEKERSFIEKIKDKVMKILYKKADHIIPVSVEIERSLIKNYKVSENKITTIYNPYNIKEIEILSKEDIENSEHKSFMKEGNVFVTIGRLTYQKGYWHLLKAISIIPNDYNVKLLIIGEGDSYSKIKKMIEKLNLSDRVLMVGYEKNPFKYLAKCKGYILSSLFEGFPNAMVEAMACGCPIIATDCKSGPREILYKKINLDRKISNIEYADYGIIIPELNKIENWDNKEIEEEEKLLSDAIKILIQNDDLREKLSKKSRERALDFSYETCLYNYSNVVEC